MLDLDTIKTIAMLIREVGISIVVIAYYLIKEWKQGIKMVELATALKAYQDVANQTHNENHRVLTTMKDQLGNMQAALGNIKSRADDIYSVITK